MIEYKFVWEDGFTAWLPAVTSPLQPFGALIQKSVGADDGELPAENCYWQAIFEARPDK